MINFDCCDILLFFSDTTMKDVTSRLSNLVTEYYNQNVKLNEKITELEEQIRVVKYHSM